MPGTLYITGDQANDGLLNSDGTALLVGMLLDQQVPMEWAFAGPATLHRRLGHLDASRIAAMDVEDVRRRLLREAGDPPLPGGDGPEDPRAVHRARRPTTAATAPTSGPASRAASELYRRLRDLPGYGEEKSQIFVAILAKTQGVAPEGWRDAAGKFGDDHPRSVADITGPESLARVREWKRAQKAAKRDKQDRPL